MKSPPRLWPWPRAVTAAVVALVAFALLRVALLPSGQFPRTLTAEEADALLGAKLLSERLAPSIDSIDPANAEAPLKARLKAGFETTESHPRLAALSPDRSWQRAVLEAPLPRWLGALGIGALPASEESTNLERASIAASLALAAVLGLLVWGLRREGRVIAVVAVGALVGMPGVLDAALSAGYGASALLVSALFLLGLGRVLDGRGGVLTLAALGVVMGLSLGIHPGALVLYPVVLIAWAIRRSSEGGEGGGSAHAGTLPLPSVPLLLLGLPVIALLVLVALWPALWNDTGKRLGSWLMDFGSAQSPPHQVLGLAFDQASGRSAQAFTALLQWVAWTPLPLLALWLVGFASALRRRRDGAWAPLLVLFGWLLIGSLDGGLFGGRGSLLALMWLPTAVTAAHGASATLSFVEKRLARRAAGRPVPLRPGMRATLIVAALLLVPLLQSVRGTTLGMARQSGAELRAPLPLDLLRQAARLRPLGVIHGEPASEALLPALEAAREGMSYDLRLGSLAEADLLLLTTASGAGPPAQAEPWLGEAREVARDPRPGLVVSLWERTAPGPLDKRPALPHN